MKSSTNTSPIVPPLLAMGLAILAVSTASIFIRYAQRTTPSLVIAAWRLTLATLVLTPFALRYHREEIRALKRRELALLGLSGVFLAFHFASWITSLEYSRVAIAVVLVSTTPLWVAILAALFLNERVGSLAVFGLAIALVGGGLVGLHESCQVLTGGIICGKLSTLYQGRDFIGNILALAGAWFAAGYLLIGRRMRAGLSLIAYTFLVYGTAAMILLAGVGVLRQPLIGYPPLTYWWLLALALVPQLLGHSTFNWALGYLPVAFVSVLLLGEPVGATLLALVLLGEVPGGLELLGGIFILIGIYLAARGQKGSN